MAYYGRGKNKVFAPHGLADFYKLYRTLIDKGSPYDISYSDFAYICKEVNKGVFEKIRNGEVLVLPFRLGDIYVCKKNSEVMNINYMAVDFKSSEEYNKRIVHMNKHSDGYRYSHKWTKKNAIFKFKTWYQFIPSRANKRELAKAIFDNPNKFIEDRGTKKKHKYGL